MRIMNSKTVAIICVVLVCAAGVWWMSAASQTGLLQVVMKATPFLVLLGVWVLLMTRKYPNGPGQQRDSWFGSPRH